MHASRAGLALRAPLRVFLGQASQCDPSLSLSAGLCVALTRGSSVPDSSLRVLLRRDFTSLSEDYTQRDTSRGSSLRGVDRGASASVRIFDSLLLSSV